MAVFIAQNLAPIMFAALVVFLLLGYPVAFSLAANGLLFFFIAVELAPYAPANINLSWSLLQELAATNQDLAVPGVGAAVPTHTKPAGEMPGDGVR